MAVIAIVVGDARIGLGGALFVATIISVRFIDRHVTFSFGAGFVGYRADMGWPHGVQEDDDFHWDWRPRTDEPRHRASELARPHRPLERRPVPQHPGRASGAPGDGPEKVVPRVGDRRRAAPSPPATSPSR